ncbi:MAG: glycine cleavage system aminomethyltransferase GcvT [Pseudomonadota bacterium]
MATETAASLTPTPLLALHESLGARIVPFAGYALPVQYPAGVMKEHLHTRSNAGLFDVSHMGQILLRARSGNAEDAAAALETLVPANYIGLGEGRQRYGFFTNDAGGIEDDLMVANRGDHLLLVVNAACKASDLAHLKTRIGDRVEVTLVEDRALLALQGPKAEAALADVAPGTSKMRFMDSTSFDTDFGTLWVSRSGYTGEDGFEISVMEGAAEPFAGALLANASVEPIGLGARDSLRLEAGLCLYGSDINAATSPAEADLGWAIQKIRRKGGASAGGFPGAERILEELELGSSRRRVGLRPEGRAPMRAGTQLFASETGSEPIGQVTSGAFGPSLGAPVSMAYLPAEQSAPDTRIWAEVRGKRLPARVAPMPFHPHSYKR